MTRKPEELVAMADHLAYEVEMMVLSGVEASLRIWPSPESRFGRNLALESFTIHARVLWDVFYRAGGAGDDVTAKDYLGVAVQWPPPAPSGLPSLKFRTGKEIAHLTWHRLKVAPADKGWDIKAVTEALVDVIRQFLAIVDPALLGPHLDRIRRAIDWYSTEGTKVHRPELAASSLPSTGTYIFSVTPGGTSASSAPFAPSLWSPEDEDAEDDEE